MNECPSACHECVVVRVWIFAPMSVDVTCSMRTMGPFCARKQERRPRTRTAGCSQYVCRVGWRKGAPSSRALHHEEPPRVVPTACSSAASVWTMGPFCARKQERRPRTRTAGCSQYVCRVGWRKGAPSSRALHHAEPPRVVPTACSSAASV